MISMPKIAYSCAIGAGLSVSVMGAGPVKADAVADFYQGKTVSIFVPFAPGGIYSNMAQIMANHFGKFIPGKPNVVVKNMPGAGGHKAFNYVYNAAQQDGTALLTPSSGAVKSVALKQGNPRYDPLKVHWLGGWGGAVSVLSVLKATSPAKSMEEAKTKQVILGSIGRNSEPFFLPTFYNNVFGTKFKIIAGYRGGSPIRLAMEKGELHGWHGQFAGWRTRKPEWIREGKLIHIVQLAPKRSKHLKDVPIVAEFAKDDEQRQMIAFLAQNATDRAMVAPPGVPADRVAALEKAFQALIRDQAFVADAEKRKYEIDALTAKEVTDAVKGIMATPPELVVKMKKLMGLK